MKMIRISIYAYTYFLLNANHKPGYPIIRKKVRSWQRFSYIPTLCWQCLCPFISGNFFVPIMVLAMVELSAFPEVAVILVNVGCLHSRTWDCCLEARRFRRTEGCNERIIFCKNQKTHLCSWLVILLLNELDRVVEKWVFYFKYICIYKTIANILYCDIIYDYSIL